MMTQRKILLVEGTEPTLSLSLQERPEYKVFRASHGGEAVQKTEEHQPDVILLDLGLLNLNVAAVTRQMRSVAPDVKLLLLSQEASLELSGETFRLSAQGCIHRQSVATDLIPAIEMVLAGKRFVSSSMEFSQDAEELRSRLAAIVESSDDAIISKSLSGVIESWNSGAEHIFGYTEKEAIGQPITFIIPPELHHEEATILRRLEAGHRMDHYETHRIAKDGRIIEVSLTVSPIRDAKGRIIGASKVARDISDRKRAEEDLSRMNRRLIEAQDEERRRVARELHDDISQQISLVLVGLERWRVHQSLVTEVQEGIAEVIQQAVSLGRAVRALSHRLHSSSLNYLGLAEAASGFCREVSAQHKVKVIFQGENVSMDLPREVSVCLFRVLQEALQNAIRYSGTLHFHVSLVGAPGEIHLTVLDSGIGFDPEEAIKKGGLGLTSMRERMKLVDGKLYIESRLGLGTTVHAQVPLRAKSREQADS